MLARRLISRDGSRSSRKRRFGVSGSLIVVASAALFASSLATGAVGPAVSAQAASSAIVPGFNSTSFGGNDDGSYPCTGPDAGVPGGCTPTAVSLPFSVNFFGSTYSSVYVNNNGDLTFGQPLSTFTPYPLSNAGPSIIAPFFADVDTRVGNTVTFGGGTVNGHPAFGVNWPGVGCYSDNTSVLDNFQVLLIDRSDIGAGDFDVEFNYAQIRWDSGQASGGNSSCQGGTAARAGYAGGSGATGTYYEIPGSGIDGAFLDSNATSGLIYGHYNSTQPGRYVYRFRGGQGLTTNGAPDSAVGRGSGMSAVNNTTCSNGPPVNCASGDFWHTFTDVSIPGRGPALSLSRTYNSLASGVSGMFGYGWASSYGMHLAMNSDGTVTITAQDGSQVTAAPAGGGGYTLPVWADSTLRRNTGGTRTFVRRQTQTFTFTAAGALSAISDPNGDTTTLSYNSAGQLTTATGPAGRTLTFAYGPNGLVSAVTDPAHRVTRYAYDSDGNLTSVTDPAGGATAFTYDPNHLLLTMTDPRGGVLTNAYDSSGRVTSQTDPLGHITKYAYSGANFSATGGTTTITDPNGNTETQQYTSGELMTLTRAAGTGTPAVTTYTYDPDTLGRTSVTDPDGHTTTYTYDAHGNQTSATDPLGRTTTTTYNSFNEPTAVTDPSGVTTTISYDAHGNPLSQSRPLTGTGTTQTVRLTYGDSAHPGDVTALANPDGNTWAFGYDANGDRVSITNPLGDKTTYTFDNVGELTSTVTPQGNAAGANPAAYTTSYSYDPLGDLTKVTDPLGHSTRYSYDGDGNVTATTDANGNATRYSYNADNELTTAARADGTKLAYTYDANGNQASQANAGNQVTRYAYDPLNQVTAVTDPLGRTTAYGYDPAGNLISVEAPGGTATAYGYDAASELTSIAYSDNTPGVAFTYTPDGQRASMTDGTGTTSYAYDSLNRLTSQTDGHGATVGYGYDLAGNLTALTYPNGKAVTRGYNAAGQLTSITDWLGHTTRIARNPDGLPATETYGNGVTTATSYNATGQITGITDTGPSGTLASFAYTRDPNGQLTGAAGPGNASDTYSYTALNQLSSDNTAAYAYSPAGSPVQLTGATQLAYDSAGQLLSATADGYTITYGYDKAGDRTSVSGGPDTSAGACAICVLDPAGAGALTAAGKAGKAGMPTVSSTGVITVDSASPNAITAVGNGTITGSKIYTAGTAATRGNGAVTPQPGAGSASDPFAGTAAPSVSGTPKPLTVGSGSSTAQPGVYSSISTSGSGTTLTLAPGDYVLAGGDMNIAGGSTVKGHGVTIYLACASYPAPCARGEQGAALAVSGSARLSLDQAAAHSGIAVLADPANTAPITVSGHSVLDVTGHIYTASGRLAVSGTGTLKAKGTIAASRVSVTGGGTLADTGPVHALPGTTYTYDAEHRLTRIATGAATTRYTYDGDGLRASAATGSTVRHFAWDLTGRVPLLLTDGTANYIYDDNGTPVEQISANGTPLWYQHDQLGSTRLLTDQAGAVVATFTYSPYGQLTRHTGTADTQLRWAGQYQDPSGLYYLVNRYYDPATAQFLTVDPLVRLTQEPYGYAYSNPLSLTDPLGLWGWKNLVSDVTHAAHAVTQVAQQTAQDVSQGARDVNEFVYQNASTISAVTGIAAAITAEIPGVDVVSPVLAGIAVGTGILATKQDIANHDYVQAGIDAFATVVGGAGLAVDLSARLSARGAEALEETEIASRLLGWFGSAIGGAGIATAASFSGGVCSG